jgi:hypothetical protein
LYHPKDLGPLPKFVEIARAVIATSERPVFLLG